MLTTDQLVTKGLLVMAAAGTILGIGTHFGVDYSILTTLLAGSGWTLVVALLASAEKRNQRIVRLEADLAELGQKASEELLEAKNQAQEWKTIAAASSSTLESFVKGSMDKIEIRPRKLARPRSDGDG